MKRGHISIKATITKKSLSGLRADHLFLLLIIVSLPLGWSGCDPASMWDYLNKDLVTSRLTVDRTGITLAESETSTGEFYVNMMEKPAALVIVALSLTDDSEARLVADSNDVLGPSPDYQGAHLEFTPGNWKDPQTINFTGADDNELDGVVTSRCVFELISADERYNGFKWEPVTITSSDNEIRNYFDNSGYASETDVLPYTSISSNPLLTGSGETNDALYPVALGFTFNFCGKDFTSINISTNGMLSFDGTAAGNLNDNTELFADTGPSYVLAPWWDNLSSHITTAFSQIYWGSAGTAPNRIMVLEWKNATLSGVVTTTFNFQVRLHETTNVIEFKYGTKAFLTTTGTVSASLGIKGVAEVGDNYIDGTTGSTTGGRADLGFADFPAENTIIRFTPRS